ncbi:CinA family protein [Chelativorans intermedius]|uniref:CinA family protein n=1 Tax=Chelativorans intermedius TaxID=515947 RepID=A0ABV6D766_9HYPH|nr:CinA family protein [Chelativorans intermedius]MCT8999510.1 CinA family protein [Chelativorans intermedius]
MRDVETLAKEVLEACRARRMMLATAESCTGGMIAAALTDLAGASDVLERGFITYSNEAKMEMLGVAQETLATHGAVSAETAGEMAAGALARSRAAIAVSVTGVAGPGGGTAQKPVGLVWFGLATSDGQVRVERQLFTGPRDAVRRSSVAKALELALEAAYAERP